MTVESRVIVQDFVNVYDLFDIARQAAGVTHLGYTTWLDGVIRTLQTPAGHQTMQISQRYDAAGRPYPAGDGDQPTGWAIVTATTDGGDGARVQHDRFTDELGHWLTAQALSWCWQHNDDDLWTVGNTTLSRH